MENRKSFILHFDSLDVIEELTDEQAWKLFKKMKSYHNGNTYDSKDKLIDILFIQFKNQFDRDIQKYDKTCERNKNNVGKRWNKEDTKNTTGINGIPVDTKNTYNKNDSKSKSDNKSDNKNNTLADKSAIQIWFDNFYSLYPKKINRKDAGLKYAIALKKWATIEIIEKGLKRSLYFWNSENTEKKFIPAPDVWLNKEKWNDEIKSEVPQNWNEKLLEAKKRLEASPRTPISFN